MLLRVASRSCSSSARFCAPRVTVAFSRLHLRPGRPWLAPLAAAPALPQQSLPAARRRTPLAFTTAAAAMATSTAGPSSGGGHKLELEVVEIDNPKEYNFILGHAHFIKTVEDIYEALVQSSASLKFGLAFCEASEGSESMPGRKVRFDGNSEELTQLAASNALRLGAGHTFIVFLDGGFPVNCLNAVKAVPEVCRIHCATANPTKVILASTGEDEKGILGVVDGLTANEMETEENKQQRRAFLRMIGYKR